MIEREIPIEIKIITTFDNAMEYLLNAKNGDCKVSILWQKYMIEPFWKEIAAYAPFDQSFKQPPCIKKLEKLEIQLSILSKFDTDALKLKFTDIAKALPSDDDDPMLVALYPLCDSNKIVKKQQNGVVGASVFGNMIININPLADCWEKWVPFVFAHEYHHNIWGHNWYVLHGGKDLEGTFLEYLITEGQADLFAMSLFPGLAPEWNKPFDTETEKILWKRIMHMLYSKDPETHHAYMFGDEEKGLPWCIGYVFGRMIVSDYLQKHAMPFSELLNIPAKQIFEASRFYQG